MEVKDPYLVYPTALGEVMQTQCERMTVDGEGKLEPSKACQQDEPVRSLVPCLTANKPGILGTEEIFPLAGKYTTESS